MQNHNLININCWITKLTSHNTKIYIYIIYYTVFVLIYCIYIYINHLQTNIPWISHSGGSIPASLGSERTSLCTRLSLTICLLGASNMAGKSSIKKGPLNGKCTYEILWISINWWIFHSYLITRGYNPDCFCNLGCWSEYWHKSPKLPKLNIETQSPNPNFDPICGFISSNPIVTPKLVFLGVAQIFPWISIHNCIGGYKLPLISHSIPMIYIYIYTRNIYP